jgi:hypothetical protein
MLLELKNASLSLDGRTLFSRLSLMAHSGQLTCISGVSGTGKTALLRVLMGFLPLDEGLVSIEGELLTPLSAPAFRKLMAYLPQPEPPVGSTVKVRTRGLETVWTAGFPSDDFSHSAPVLKDDDTSEPYAQEDAPLPAVCEKALKRASIILADDPGLSLLSRLKALVAEGRIVVVASCREEFINMSDKTIILGNDDNHLR